MLIISPTCFGIGVTFSGSLRTRNARCDWQNTSSASVRLEVTWLQSLVTLEIELFTDRCIICSITLGTKSMFTFHPAVDTCLMHKFLPIPLYFS